MATLNFDQVKQSYAKAQADGAFPKEGTLSQYSQEMQGVMPEHDWSAGHSPDNFVGSFSRGVDSTLASTGIPDYAAQAGGAFGGAVDSLVGNTQQRFQKTGEEVGRSLPRGIVDTGLVLGGGALTAASAAAAATGVGAPLGAMGAPLGLGMIGAGIADAGAKGYTDTGSVGAGVTSAAITGLSPLIGGAGSALGVKMLGTPLVEGVSTTPIRNFIASEIGQNALFSGVNAGQRVAQGGDLLDAEGLFGDVVGAVAFAPVTIHQGIKAAGGLKPKAVTDPSSPLVSNRTDLARATGVLGDGELPQVVDRNNYARLFDYLIGHKDEEMAAHLDKGNFRSALRLSGLLTEDLPASGNTQDAIEGIGKRSKGRELVNRAAYEQSVRRDPSDLIRRASKLLGAAPENVVDLVNNIKLINELQANIDAKNFPPPNPKKGKLRPRAASVDEGAQYGVEGKTNPMTPEEVAYEGQFKNGNYETPTGLRPNAVKGKPSDLGARLAAPEFQQIGGDSRLTDSSGRISSDTIQARHTELMRDRGMDPDSAMHQITQEIRGELAVRTREATPGFIQSAKTVLENTLLRKGIDPAIIPEHVAAAERILSQMDVPKGSEVRPITDPTVGTETNRILAAKGRAPVDLSAPDSDIVGVHLAGAAPQGGSILGLGQRNVYGNSKVEAHATLQTLVHEAVHSVFTGLQGKIEGGVETAKTLAYTKGLAYAQELLPEQRVALMQAAHDAVSGQETLNSTHNKQAAEYAGATANEFMTDYTSLVAMETFGNPAKLSKVHSLLRSLPEPMRQFLHGAMEKISNLTAAVRAAAMFNGFSPEKINSLKDFQSHIDTILKPDPVLERAKATVMDSVKGPAAVEAGDIAGNGVQFQKTGSAAIDKEVQGIKGSNAFTRWMMQHQQIANSPKYREAIPAYGKVVALLTKMDSLAVTLQHAVRSPFMVSVDGGVLKQLTGVSDGKLTAEQIMRKGNFARVGSNKQLELAVHEAMRVSNTMTQEAGLQGIAYPDFNTPEIKALFDRFSPEDRSAAELVFNGYKKANQQVADHRVAVEVERLGYVAGEYFLGAGMGHDQAEKSGRILMQGLAKGMLEQVPAEIREAPGAEAAIAHWEAVKDKFDAFKNNLDRPYFNEMRSGRWGVKYIDGQNPDGTENHGFISSENKTELKAIQNHLREQGKTILSIEDRYNKDKTDWGQMQVRGIEQAAELVRAHYEAFRANMEPEAAAQMAEVMKEYSPSEPLTKEANAKLQSDAARRFAPGREMLDMVAAQDAYSSLMARKLANQMTRMETNWLMKHPDWNKDAPLKAEMLNFKNGVLSAGKQEFKGFRKAVTLMTMGTNVSSAMVDVTQSLMMGVWRAAEDVGVASAMKHVSAAYVNAFKPLNLMDKGFAALLTDVTNRGFLKTGGHLGDFVTGDEHANFNVVQAGQNRTVLDTKGLVTNREFLAGKVFEQIGSLGQKAFDMSMMPYKLSSQINDKVMLYAGYKMGQDKGLTGKPLHDYAINLMQVTNVQGQRAAHSSFKLKAGQMNGVVEAATLLTNYPLAAISQMYGNFQSMLKSSGLDSAARKKAGAAFAGQALMQFTMAGSLALGLDVLFAMSKEWFGINPEDEIRQSLAAVDESGTLGEVLMNGVASQVTGADLSSRFSLSGVGGLNPYTGFDARGVFGAGGGLISALYNAPADFAKGDVTQMRLIPNGVRKMIGAMSGAGFNDKSGQALIDPTQSEQMMQFIGFKPKRMADVQDQRTMMKSIDQITSGKEVEQKQELSKLMLSGDFSTVLQKVQTSVLDKLQQPEYAQLTGLEANKVSKQLFQQELMGLVQFAVEKSSPQDPMSQGSRASAQARTDAAKGYGQTLVPRASEQARVQLQAQLLQGLGVAGSQRRIPKALVRARKIDEVIMQNPGLSKQQAVEMVDNMPPF